VTSDARKPSCGPSRKVTALLGRARCTVMSAGFTDFVRPSGICRHAIEALGGITPVRMGGGAKPVISNKSSILFND
jgi:hypothetical protein